MSIATELLALKDEEGLIKTRTAHAWARAHKRSDLHKAIDWDLERGAYQWQLIQVSNLIKLHITFPQYDGPGVISLSSDRVKEGGGYRLLADVLPSREWRRVMVEDAFAELQRLQRKYEILTELAGIWAAADEARAATTRKVRTKSKPVVTRKRGRVLEPAD